MIIHIEFEQQQILNHLLWTVKTVLLNKWRLTPLGHTPLLAYCAISAAMMSGTLSKNWVISISSQLNSTSNSTQRQTQLIIVAEIRHTSNKLCNKRILATEPYPSLCVVLWYDRKKLNGLGKSEIMCHCVFVNFFDPSGFGFHWNHSVLLICFIVPI